MTERLNILYVGPLWEGGTCLQRMRALQELGHSVVPINFAPESALRKQRFVLYRVRRKIFGPEDLSGANEQIIGRVESAPYDILWLDKAMTIEVATLLKVKETQETCLIVGYSPDDMYARHNQSRQFLQHLSFYDIFFTTKSYGVDELVGLGCPRVEFVGNAFDPTTHRPLSASEEDRHRFGGSVGFVGSYERERAASMFHLAANDIPVRAWGDGWNRCRCSHKNLRIEGRAVWGTDYARTMCSFDINLCFLRKINRDRQTTRSVEIPACAAFMLAERTDEHLQLFEEGKEVEFFDSDEELLGKVRYYLAHPRERERIAAAGRERCLKSGYSNHDRLRRMLQEVERLKR